MPAVGTAAADVVEGMLEVEGELITLFELIAEELIVLLELVAEELIVLLEIAVVLLLGITVAVESAGSAAAVVESCCV